MNPSYFPLFLIYYWFCWFKHYKERHWILIILKIVYTFLQLSFQDCKSIRDRTTLSSVFFGFGVAEYAVCICSVFLQNPFIFVLRLVAVAQENQRKIYLILSSLINLPYCNQIIFQIKQRLFIVIQPQLLISLITLFKPIMLLIIAMKEQLLLPFILISFQ